MANGDDCRDFDRAPEICAWRRASTRAKMPQKASNGRNPMLGLTSLRVSPRARSRPRCWRSRQMPPRAERQSDHDRLCDVAHRPARRQRQAGAARHADLGRGDQRQGRTARASGQARLLRRPDQSVDRSGHLHQAARRRQGRPRGRPVRHQHGGARDAGDHAEGQGVHHPVRSRGEHRVQVSEVLRHDPVGSRSEAVLHARLLRDRGGAEPEAADRRAGRGRCRVRQQRLRGRAHQRGEVRLQGRL